VSSAGIGLEGETGDRQERQDRGEPFVVVDNDVGSLSGSFRRQEHIIGVWNLVFVTIRDLYAKGKTPVHGLLDLLDTHTGIVVRSWGFVNAPTFGGTVGAHFSRAFTKLSRSPASWGPTSTFQPGRFSSSSPLIWAT